MDSEISSLIELVPFLRDPKPKVRQVAVSHIAAYTGKDECVVALLQTNATSELARLLSDRTAISAYAAKALINFSASGEAVNKMSSLHIVRRVVDILIHTGHGDESDEEPPGELLGILITNLTRDEAHARELLEHNGMMTITLLLRALQEALASAPRWHYFRWVPSAVANAAFVDGGAKLLVQSGVGNAIPLCIDVFDSIKDDIFRRAVASFLRNLFLSHDDVKSLDNLDDVAKRLVRIVRVEQHDVTSLLIGECLVSLATIGHYDVEEVEAWIKEWEKDEKRIDRIRITGLMKQAISSQSSSEPACSYSIEVTSQPPEEWEK